MTWCRRDHCSSAPLHCTGMCCPRACTSTAGWWVPCTPVGHGVVDVCSSTDNAIVQRKVVCMCACRGRSLEARCPPFEVCPSLVWCESLTHDALCADQQHTNRIVVGRMATLAIANTTDVKRVWCLAWPSPSQCVSGVLGARPRHLVKGDGLWGASTAAVATGRKLTGPTSQPPNLPSLGGT